MERNIRKSQEASPQILLIVDDDEINRSILNNIFAAFYTVEEAENGCVGLDKILSAPRRYCAVLLDVMMPVIDGLEVPTQFVRPGDAPEGEAAGTGQTYCKAESGDD